tara:strand:- start:666 stop:950 length:285 start_codon:yes stop_codon:yes gene_type:complete
MDSKLTNKELLNQIAIKQLKLSSQVSDFMIAQEEINNRLIGYLENNSKTNQIGVIQKQADLEEKLDKLVAQKNVAIGVIVFISGAIAWLGNVFR